MASLKMDGIVKWRDHCIYALHNYMNYTKYLLHINTLIPLLKDTI